ncbi:hypothetical protein [Acinetobacter pittii]|uniref:hypothetical protein n=1 Tax=Acinetobacter pittii TaxID=48296 RepID=UPI000F897516|nr:hypothetical protein [Acinetobacter pittii]RSO00961.1 hypothetical protein EA767_00740 [Acinetobacter pittii]
MKLPVSCAQCMSESIENSFILGKVEFNDDGRYEVHCPKGHTSITVLQQQKFEVLFEIGAYAILDGYYREAVSSFTSALERFYEYYIRLICYTKSINLEEMENTWKIVTNQSERQLGAFIFMHLLETGTKPNLLTNNQISFRNAVIHKGKIPTKEEAIAYGQAILDLVRPQIKRLKGEYGEAMGWLTHLHVIKSRKSSDNHLSISTLSIPTILTLLSIEHPHNEQKLEDSISQLKRW